MEPPESAFVQVFVAKKQGESRRIPKGTKLCPNLFINLLCTLRNDVALLRYSCYRRQSIANQHMVAYSYNVPAGCNGAWHSRQAWHTHMCFALIIDSLYLRKSLSSCEVSYVCLRKQPGLINGLIKGSWTEIYGWAYLGRNINGKYLCLCADMCLYFLPWLCSKV